MNPEWKAFLQENGAQFISSTEDDSNTEAEHAVLNDQLAFFETPESETQVFSQELILSNPSFFCIE